MCDVIEDSASNLKKVRGKYRSSHLKRSKTILVNLDNGVVHQRIGAWLTKYMSRKLCNEWCASYSCLDSK